MSEFDFWEQELQDIDPSTFVDEDAASIATSAEDPIQRAVQLQAYVDNLSPNLYAPTLSRAVSKLIAHKHAGYYGKPIEITSMGCSAVPEKDPVFRKRPNTTVTDFTGFSFVRGLFDSIHEMPYFNADGQSKSLLTIKRMNHTCWMNAQKSRRNTTFLIISMLLLLLCKNIVFLRTISN